MAPKKATKRKQPPKGEEPEGSPPKRPTGKKNRGNEDAPSKEVTPLPLKSAGESKAAAKASGDSEKRRIRWVLPPLLKRNTKNAKNEAEKFASLLFKQTLAQLLNTERSVLMPPPIPSPVLQQTRKRSLKRTIDGCHESNRSSEQLLRLYNRIYDKIDEFTTSVKELGEDKYGVLAFHAKGLIAIDEDKVLNVTLLQSDQDEDASIQIIRHTAPNDQTSEHFVVLPEGTLVTVNGLTYNNDHTDGPVFIGPLGEFAIIELLSEPFFLWRSQNLASHDANIQHEKSNCNEEEWARRHIRPKGTDAEITFESVQDEENEDNTDDSNEQSSDEKSKTSENDHRGGATISSSSGSHISGSSIGKRKYSESTRPEQLEETITPVLLAINQLHQSRSTGFSVDAGSNLIRPGRPWILPLRLSNAIVLLVVQIIRQPNTQGGLKITIDVLDPNEWKSNSASREEIWSVASGADILQRWLPGLDLNVEEIPSSLPEHACWVGSPAAADEAEAIAITILNAWALALGLTPNPSWVVPTGIRPTDENDSGDSTVPENSDRRDSFLREAGILFHRARSGHDLDWKMLYDFFTTHQFIIGASHTPRDRQFKFKDISVEDMKRSQSNAEAMNSARIRADRAAQSGQDRITRKDNYRQSVLRGAQTMAMRLDNDRQHHQTQFPLDNQTIEFRENVVRNLVRRGHWARYMSEEVLQERYDALERGPPLPALSQFEVKREENKTLKNVNPCEYLDQELKLAGIRYKLGVASNPADITYTRVCDSIAAVTQAVGYAEGDESSFEYIDYGALIYEASETRQVPSTTWYHGNRSLLLPWISKNRQFDAALENNGNRSILFVIQPLTFEDRMPGGTNQFSVYAFDHAPWLSNEEERSKTYGNLSEALKRMTGIHSAGIQNDSISWIIGAPPNSHALWQLNYFTILNAWTIALGLKVNPTFRARDGFFQQAEYILNLVLRGLADWKLIWSFLRCKNFVKSGQIPSERRFDRTVPKQNLRTSLESLRAKNQNIPLDRHKSLLDLPSPRSNFPTDDWEPSKIDNLSMRISTLLKAHTPISELHRHELLKKFEEECNNPKLKKAGKRDFNPCRAVKSELASIFAGKEFDALGMIQIWSRYPSQAQLSNPQYASWITCANQSMDWTCGYHAIFNGWAVALGLNLDLEFERDWVKGGFFEQAQKVIIMALAGTATVELIHNFLDCHGFVLPKQTINENKAFDHTFKIESEEDLENALDSFGDKEGYYWNQFQENHLGNNLEKITGNNRVFLEDGVPHDVKRGSDSWPEWKRPYLADIVRSGLPIMDFNGAQLTYNLWIRSEEYRYGKKGEEDEDEDDEEPYHAICDDFWESQDWTGFTRPELIKQFQDYVGLDSLSSQLWEQVPCLISKLHQKSYGILRSHELMTLEPEPHWLEDSTRELELNDLTLCIAAVVQAMDHTQDLHDNGHTVVGGFALAAELPLTLAMNADHSYPLNDTVSRPRRCWLMPLVMDARIVNHARGLSKNSSMFRPLGHILLAVLQEEQIEGRDDTHFCVYLLDSAPHYLKDIRDYMSQTIRHVAKALSWSTDDVEFRDRLRFVKVTKQRTEHSCGYHTMLNAWILALGLTPSQGAHFSRKVYEGIKEIANLALAGLLDWKTLTAFLICKRFTIEKTVEAVPLNRRFQTTAVQRTNEELRGQIRRIYNTTGRITDEHANVHINNVDFTRDDWRFEEDEDEDEEKRKSKEKKINNPSQLERAMEDVGDYRNFEDWSDSTEHLDKLLKIAWEEKRYAQRAKEAPSNIELDNLAFGKRYNGPTKSEPQTPKVQSPGIQSPKTPNELEMSRPGSPTENEAVSLMQSWNNPPMNKWRIMCCCLIYFGNGINDSVVGALIPYMEEYYHIGYAIMSMVFVGNAAGFISAAFFCNMTLGKLGRAKTLVFSELVLLSAYIMLVATPPYPVVVISFFLLGYGAATSLALNNVFCANLHPPSAILGAAHGSYGLGGIIAPIIGTAMASRGVLWSRFYFLCLGLRLCCMVFAAWSFWSYQEDQPQTLLSSLERTATQQAAAETAESKAKNLKLALKNKVTIFGALFIFAYQGAEVSISGWVISFLINYRDGDPARVGYVTAGFWGGITLGRFVLTHLAPRIGEKTFVTFLTIGTLCLQLLVWLVPNVIGDAVAVSLLGLLLGPFAEGAEEDGIEGATELWDKIFLDAMVA
ncbi:hypothetical protein N0V90_003679 [Kalmusia sp. IMI 367209]|nr:hypothetical protein N0V90_003679 [Kalmusia sp. IMI 367209]